MMKKLLSFLMIGSCAILMAQNANAQACTPDASHAGNPGIYPDSITGLEPAPAGVIYNQVITVVLPSDTTVNFPGVGVVTLTMNYIKLDSAKLIVAPGDTSGYLSDINFTYACNPDTCYFAGGSSGCLVLQSNTPSVADTGTYQLIVYVTANVTHALLGTFDAPQSIIDDYFIVITGPDAVETLNTSRFEVGQNIPNPANGTTTINFTTPNQTTVDFKVYNMLGMVVQSQKVDAVSGMNKIKFNSSEFAEGVYVYTVTNGNTTISKRMVIAGK